MLRFGQFEVQSEQRRLLQDGKPVAVGARAFDVLTTLAARRERVVSKAELLDLVWPGLVVEENNLQVQVSTLRKLLGPQVIATVPGRGYRFTAVMDDALDALANASLHRQATGTVRSASPLTNLPPNAPKLYGRDQELDDLRSLIDAHRLVTIVGAGGIGKSRLAQTVSHALALERPDGAWMVELAGLSEAALVPGAVAQVLDIAVATPGSSGDALALGLAGRALLLVLDNCEHLLGAVATLVQAILHSAPNVSVLCTSQQPLHLPGEQQYRLAPLAVPAQTSVGAREFGAIALFEARVRAVDRHFALQGDRLSMAIEICRQLDGLPLAIELAAARVATLGLRPVRDKLDSRFKLLRAAEGRAALPRHQTLHATLGWSFRLLTAGEKTVFLRLGIFAGGFTAALAQAVAGDSQLDEWEVLDHLSALVDKSLVVAEGGDAPRYRLLESARAFALEQLASGEAADIAKRHALAMHHFLRQIDDANLDGELRTDQYAAQVVPELDNLRAAYAWATGEAGDSTVATALAAHAGALIDYAAECGDWLLARLPRVEEGEVDAAISARFWRAVAAVNMGARVRRPVQMDAARRAQSIYRSLDMPRRVFSSLILLARQLRSESDDTSAQAMLDEARSLLRPDWPAEFRILLLRADALQARKAGRRIEALSLQREAVRLSSSTGDWRLEVIERNHLVDLLWLIGPIEEAALAACMLAEELRTEPAGHADIAVVLSNLVGILCEMGRIDEACRAAETALPHMRRARWLYLEEWVYLFWRRGQVEGATQLLGALDSDVLRSAKSLQLNEARLITQARAALATQQDPGAFTANLAIGATLDTQALFALISSTLSQPSGCAV